MVSSAEGASDGRKRGVQRSYPWRARAVNVLDTAGSEVDAAAKAGPILVHGRSTDLSVAGRRAGRRAPPAPSRRRTDDGRRLQQLFGAIRRRGGGSARG